MPIIICERWPAAADRRSQHELVRRSSTGVIARDAAPMIVICPTCDTRYRVQDQEFAGSTGRTVRCANCGHVWYETGAARQKSAAGMTDQGALANQEGAAARPVRRAVAEEVPRLDIPPRTPPASSRARSRVSGIVVIGALLAAIIIGGVFIDRHFTSDQPAPAAAPHAAAAAPCSRDRDWPRDTKNHTGAHPRRAGCRW